MPSHGGPTRTGSHRWRGLVARSGAWLDARVSVGEAIALVVFFLAVWVGKWVSDDGYIYLTYVQNLVDNGDGAVFNAGEQVEAYTSVAWFSLLSLLAAVAPRSWLGLPELTLLLSVAVSIGAACRWPAVERRATAIRSSAGRTIVCVPLALMAATYVFRSFATSGLETPLLFLWAITTIGWLWSFEPNTRRLAFAAGVAPIVRPDLALVSLILVALVAWRWARARRAGGAAAASNRDAAALVALAAVPLAVTTLVRVMVYGQLLPNTYYAKTDAGQGASQGLHYLADIAWRYGLPVVLAAAVATIVVPVVTAGGLAGIDAGGRARLRRRLLLAAIATVTAIYVVVIGGDFMHGRFWITPWLFLLGMLAGAGTDVASWAVARRSTSPGRLLGPSVGVVVTAVLLVTILPMGSRQRAADGGSDAMIHGIVDEAVFYAGQNPNLHDFGAANESFLYQAGRVAADVADRLDQEIGVSVGAIGQFAFASQLGGGRVFVFDQGGLTRAVGSRLEPVVDGRVGHSRDAPIQAIALHPRVDLILLGGRAPILDELVVELGGLPFQIVDLTLIDDLVAAGLILPEQAGGIDAAITARLVVSDVDPDLVTFLTERAPPDAPYRDRLAQLAELDADSPWRRWLERTAASAEVLGDGGCPSRNPLQCLELAIDRHRVGQLPRAG